jgi:hypothetical protein
MGSCYSDSPQSASETLAPREDKVASAVLTAAAASWTAHRVVEPGDRYRLTVKAAEALDGRPRHELPTPARRAGSDKQAPLLDRNRVRSSPGRLGLRSRGTARRADRTSTKDNHKEDTIHIGPSAWLTSNGFHSDTQWVRFLQSMLARRKVLLQEDASPLISREELIRKYSAEIARLKVTYINDSNFHRDENMVNDAKEKREWFFWDNELHAMLGIPKENITMIQILEKPWLFNRPGRKANYQPQEPNVKELDPEDEGRYYAALQLTQVAFKALHDRNPPLVGAGQAGRGLPGCPASGRSCANELAEISRELNEKYTNAFEKWCQEYIDGADLICGQGGEVVLLNMAWGCNQILASRLATSVLKNNVVYIGMSASTMVTAQSIEMSNEVQPGWIEAFAVDQKFLLRNQNFLLRDLNEEGTPVCMLGTLPLFQSPFAIRPHYTAAWEEKVLEMNLLAEKEFEEETGEEIDDTLVRDSNCGVNIALRLLNSISKHALDQEHPVFVPMRDGVAVEVNYHANPYTEVFYVRR